MMKVASYIYLACSFQMVTEKSTQGELTTKEVGVGDMAVYTLWSNLTNGGYADYVMEVTVNTLKGIPRLEACSARLWNYKGSFDIPYINTTFIDPEIVDGKFYFKFSRIHVTAQVSIVKLKKKLLCWYCFMNVSIFFISCDIL